MTHRLVAHTVLPPSCWSSTQVALRAQMPSKLSVIAQHSGRFSDCTPFFRSYPAQRAIAPPRYSWDIRKQAMNSPSPLEDRTIDMF